MSKFSFSEEANQQILQRLTNIEALLKTKQNNPDDVFLDNQEFLQTMNISKRLAQGWRDEKIIAYSQIGNKIYYRMSDIIKLLENNRIEPGK